MAEQAKAQDAPPKDKKKLFIIIGAAVALLAIGGGAMFFLGGSKSEAKPAHGEAKVEAKAEGGHGEAKPGEAAIGVYPLEPFIVNIYDGQEIRYLKLKVEFELANAQVKPELDAKVAPLRDAILILLTTKTMQEIQDLQGKNQLREQILAAVGKIIPPGKVTKIYFTDFVVQ
ncbi:MAG: flagellar basal body protein FliL [Geobacteraceae bacterium GWC2_58_44]|nr:MAG: flagellar basal body protein FliL [Geobacteraceae bacterium GWC2_58_44]HBG04971.1 flagellar basal body protein FliL [Geobacter sp.]